MRWLVALVWLIQAPNLLAQQKSGLQLDVIGASEPALLESENCSPSDMPDAPARAIRLADGTVQLYAADQVNRANVGPDLRHLHHDCAVKYQGGHQDDPAAFDDRTWIASLWTEDGRTIWALLHNEFQGHRRPALCPSGKYMNCWYNSISLAVSDDTGRSFRRVGLVAALPYRFDELGPGHHGYFNPSNIVRGDDALYAFTFATRAADQQPGNCLLRTTEMTSPALWRAWDGAAFTVGFADPYRLTEPKVKHVCTPVAPSSLRWPVTSLVRQRDTGLYLVLMEDTSANGGIYYASSADLLHWSSPRLLMQARGPLRWDCRPPAPLFYPSLLDPDSPNASFDTIGWTVLLFATTFETKTCKTLRDRTLTRWSVQVRTIHD